MDTGTLYELIGYVGSALVVISMLMTSVVRLRVINLVGSLIFTCYALLIRSYPTAAMNLSLVGINIWHLIRLLRTKKHYDLIPTDPKDGYLAYLLQTGMDDILTFFRVARVALTMERQIMARPVPLNQDFCHVRIWSAGADQPLIASILTRVKHCLWPFFL